MREQYASMCNPTRSVSREILSAVYSAVQYERLEAHSKGRSAEQRFSVDREAGDVSPRMWLQIEVCSSGQMSTLIDGRKYAEAPDSPQGAG